MASSKSKNTTRKPGRPGKNEPKRKAQQDTGFIRAEVGIILSFALAVILFLSNFHLCGAFGDILRSVQLGLFGCMGFLAPLLIFVGTAFYISNRGNPAALRKLLASAVLVIVICAFAQLFFGAESTDGTGLMAAYHNSAVHGGGGGLIGGLVCFGLKSAIGTVGALIVLAVFFIICAVCITEKSVVKAVSKGGSQVYQNAREEMAVRREMHEERRAIRAEERAVREEERRRLRKERIRGVNISSTDLSVDHLTEREIDPVGTLESADRPDIARSAAAESAELMETETAKQDVNRADIFTGSIFMPNAEAQGTDTSVAEEKLIRIHNDAATADLSDDDIAPFDEDRVLSAAESAQRLVEEGAQHYLDSDDIFPKLSADEAAEEEIYLEPDCHDIQPDPDPNAAAQGIPDEGISEDSSAADTFKTSGGEKRIVTASGKIIDTDTEALQKKLEKARREAKEATGEAQVADVIKEKEEEPKREYVFPPTGLLKKGSRIAGNRSEKQYRETAIKLQQTLQNFGVGVTVTNISCGPNVTRYELHPQTGVKVSRIVGLADDIKLSLAAEDIRIEAPIPGKSAVGIEVPNKEQSMVYLRDLLESDAFKKHHSSLAFAVGKDIGGQVVVTDIAKMPHLLIAGQTGSGKSVCINTLIMSIIYKSKPEDVKLILIDPKVVELSIYNGIPHLLIPVVTDPKKAAGALNWAVAEMTDRYKKFARYGVRDIKGYNARVDSIRDIEDENKPQKMPKIVIIIDELADLMMVASNEVEEAICRLAQLARACGIHLVIATQRPSVNVITGLIKANVPSRIAFSVASGVDSRTILDMYGAEKLLGHGDMLFYPAGYPKPQRVQGTFVSDEEVQAVCDFLSDQGMVSQFDSEVEKKMNSGAAASAAAAGEAKDSRDEYFAEAGRFIIEKEKASIGMLQRMFKIGFNRAARIMDQLSEAGVVGEEEGTKPRKILMTMDEFETFLSHEE